MEPEPVLSRDARTGETRARIGVEADAAAVDAAVRAADATRDALADRPRRAALLRAAAETVEARADALIAVADAETALGVPRLAGELARVAYQFRFFAGIVEDGGYLGVVIDPPDPAAVPPRPELRRWKVPIGTVAVFAASNFPFAFSVPGGDTASALAAGCPVVVKAHPDHPETSELAAAAIRDAAVKAGLPADVLTLVHGRQAGVDLVRHPLISAVGFTGSIPGGRALFDLAAARPAPIPFYGELGSLNPVLITERTAAARGAETAAGLVASYTLGQGQFCTKPGLVLVPAGPAGDALVATAAAAAAAAAPGALLDARMREHFLVRLRRPGRAARRQDPGRGGRRADRRHPAGGPRGPARGRRGDPGPERSAGANCSRSASARSPSWSGTATWRAWRPCSPASAATSPPRCTPSPTSPTRRGGSPGSPGSRAGSSSAAGPPASPSPRR